MKKRKAFLYKNLLLLLLIVVLAMAPFFIFRNVSFQGTDDRAGNTIKEIAPGYKAWSSSIFKPGPVGEKLLFALQAALGVSFIGYYIYSKRAKNNKDEI